MKELTSGARLRLAVSACLAAAGGATLFAASPSPASPPPRIVYGGDASFPPYEYLDAWGQPRGFNVALLRLLAEESGARVEFRLRPTSEVMQAFDAGQVDVVASPSRRGGRSATTI